MKKNVQLWLERAEYDWQTAQAMFKSGRYLYVVFTCQQVIEKMLKAVIQNKTGQLPPYTHNLVALTKESGCAFSEKTIDFLAVLTQYYIVSRYPDHKQKLSENIHKDKAQEILGQCEEVYQCLKKELRI